MIQCYNLLGNLTDLPMCILTRFNRHILVVQTLLKLLIEVTRNFLSLFQYSSLLLRNIHQKIDMHIDLSLSRKQDVFSLTFNYHHISIVILLFN